MRRYLIVLLILIFAASGTLMLEKRPLKPLPSASVLDFPGQIGAYRGNDIPLKDRIYAILETKNVVMRGYVKDSEPPILFYLIYDPKTHKSSDPPENCITGDGLAISKKETITIPVTYGNRVRNLSVVKLIAEKGAVKEVYFYWFIAGKEFLDSYFKQRLILISAYLAQRPISGGQVRISTKIVDDDEKEAVSRLYAFVKEIMPYLTKLLSE